MPEPKSETNGTLSGRDYTRVLSSIRRDAHRIKESIDQMEVDGQKLAAGGHPAPAELLREVTTAMRVVMKHIGGVFKVEF